MPDAHGDCTAQRAPGVATLAMGGLYVEQQTRIGLLTRTGLGLALLPCPIARLRDS